MRALHAFPLGYFQAIQYSVAPRPPPHVVLIHLLSPSHTIDFCLGRESGLSHV